MKRKPFDKMECGIAQALESIGNLWSILILRDAMFGVQTFDGFHSSLEIPKNTLANCLNALVESDLFARAPDPEDGRRVIYTLQPAGQDLFIVLAALSQWGNKWVYENSDRAPSFVADKKHHAPIEPISIFDKAGKPLTIRDITMILGPSGSPSLAEKFAAAGMPAP